MTSPSQEDETFRLGDLFRLQPVPAARYVAVRAGLSVGVPLLAVIALGRTEWALYAAFGAFTALYGRDRLHRPRAVMQLVAGTCLTVAVALGATVGAIVGTTGTGAWPVVAVGAVVAALGAVASAVLGWHPPGPLFLVFGFGAVASVPATWDDVPLAAAVAGVSALFAVAVGNAGAYLRRQSDAPRPALPAPAAADVRRDALRHLVAVGVAGALAVGLGDLVGTGHPYWAMVAAAAPLSAAARTHQVRRAWHRVGGTLLGLVTAAPLLLLGLDPVPSVLVVVMLQVATELLVGRNYGLALLCITPMALLMGQLGRPQATGDLLWDRGVETAIGVAVALGVILLGTRRRSVPEQDPVPGGHDD